MSNGDVEGLNMGDTDYRWPVLFYVTCALVILVAFPIEAQTVDRWLNRMDANGDGQISAEEWNGGTPFTRIDRDGNGQATRDELSLFQKLRKKKRGRKKARLHHRFPNARFHSPAGQSMDLKDLRGRVVALIPIATWCPPCVRRLPDYISIYDQYKNSGKVAVILYNWKDHFETVASYVRKYGGGHVTVFNAGDTGYQGAKGYLKTKSGRTFKMPGGMPQAWLLDQWGVVAQERTRRAGRPIFWNMQRFCADIERLTRNLPVQYDWSAPIDYEWEKWSSC